MPWIIAIAEFKEAARVALAAKRALEKDLRHFDTLVERLDEEHAGSRWKPILRYRMSTTKSKCAAKPPGASAIRITNSRRNKPSRRLAGSSGK